MLVDEANGEVRWTVDAHAGDDDGQSCVAMSPDNGRFVASVSSSEENWKLWDVASGAEWMAGARHDGTAACICEVHVQGHRVKQEGCPVVAHTEGIRALAFSPCGQSFATGDLVGAVILWDAQTGEAGHHMAPAFKGDSVYNPIYALGFAADGARLASGGEGGSVSVWDVPTGALLRIIQVSEDSVTSLHFSPTDSRRLATASDDELIRVWDIDSGEMKKSFAGLHFAVFSPDGGAIATCSASPPCHDVVLFDIESGELRLTLVGHQSPPDSAATFSGEDGSKLASVSIDNDACKVWDLSTGATLRNMRMFPPVSMSWGRDWVRDTQGAMAFAMGHHPRLGETSRVLALDAGVVRMILDRV